MEIYDRMSEYEKDTYKRIVGYFSERGVTVLMNKDDPLVEKPGYLGIKRASELYWKYQLGS